MTPRLPRFDPRRASRWRAGFVLAAAVVIGHALLLALLPKGAGDGWRGDERRVLQMRRIVVAPAAQAPAEIAPAPAAAPKPRPQVAAAAAAPTALDAATAVVEAAPVLVEPGLDEVPTYPTRPPPPVLLRYELQRGALRGDADLDWNPTADGYEATLVARLLSAPLLAFASRGRFDPHGLAPERFVDRRARRSAQAANFRRDEGRITFSGPGVELPLAPGAQDRLSWMLQLAAIVDADPTRFAPGARVAMWVVGARGDADVWTFEVDAVEPLDLPAGRVEAALRLQRAPRRPYDLRAEVWLDPARHHLPVRVRLVATGSGEGTSFDLAGFLSR